jgi:hypothetical protein
MTTGLSYARGSAAGTVRVSRRLVAPAMAAAMLALAGCGDAYDESDDDASGAGCRALAADPAWYGDNRGRINAMISEPGTCRKSPTSKTGYSEGGVATERDVTPLRP